MPFRDFTLEDFRNQIKTIHKMGSLNDLMEMIPGLKDLLVSDATPDPDQDLRRMEAILDSMTVDERKHPHKIDQRRCERIARGAGTEPPQIARLLKDFTYMAIFAEKQPGYGTGFSTN